jgi:hypothetical protein
MVQPAGNVGMRIPYKDLYSGRRRFVAFSASVLRQPFRAALHLKTFHSQTATVPPQEPRRCFRPLVSHPLQSAGVPFDRPTVVPYVLSYCLTGIVCENSLQPFGVCGCRLKSIVGPPRVSEETASAIGATEPRLATRSRFWERDPDRTRHSPPTEVWSPPTGLVPAKHRAVA